MTPRRVIVFAACLLSLLLALFCNLGLGETRLGFSEMVRILADPDANRGYNASILLYQRLPRSLIAIYVGIVMASSGLVFQGLVRNPLASSSTLGVNAGATMFVIISAVFLDFSVRSQGIAALAGGLFGFGACIVVARIASSQSSSRDLVLILSGSLVAMLFYGITNAVLLGHPALRTDYLSWMTGNINHVYSDRLWSFWWIGAVCMICLMVMARPLTLMLLGTEKARSLGVQSRAITWAAMLCAILGASSATAICGPIAFVGLVVPHIIRPLVGQNFVYALPATALAGAVVCLIADMAARMLFLPYIVHTGIIMDVFGGLVFIWIIRRFYLRTAQSGVST